MTGIELIAQEREEQIGKHGWTLEHDKEHEFGELAIVAAGLAIYHTDALRLMDNFVPEWYKRLADHLHGDTIHRLQVAGALIAAEIDRLKALEEMKNCKICNLPIAQYGHLPASEMCSCEQAIYLCCECKKGLKRSDVRVEVPERNEVYCPECFYSTHEIIT